MLPATDAELMRMRIRWYLVRQPRKKDRVAYYISKPGKNYMRKMGFVRALHNKQLLDKLKLKAL